MAKVLLSAILFVRWCARTGPVSLGPMFDRMALGLMKHAHRVRPMLREECNVVDPFIATLLCEDVNCGEMDVVLSLGGTDPTADFECQYCGNESGGIL